MLQVMISKAQTGAELRKDLEQWLQQTRNPPAVIVAHETLPFDSDEEIIVSDPDSEGNIKVTYRNITVLTLDDFFETQREELLLAEDDDMEDDAD